MLTINLNGIEVNGTATEIAELLKLQETATPNATPKAKAPKAKADTAKAKKAKAEKNAKKAKAEKAKAPRYDAELLDSKRVERMVNTAVERFNADKLGISVFKQGTWVWLYSNDKHGRTDAYKSVSLPKGWKYSPKRGAFYRNFKTA